MELTELSCKPVKRGMPALNDSEISYYKEKIHPEWRIVGTKKISRNFNFDNYKNNIAFVNKVAEIAEKERHHPNIYNFCSNVTIEISTNIIKGLSENDFILASKIDSL